jgi:hypothetical protein
VKQGGRERNGKGEGERETGRGRDRNREGERETGQTGIQKVQACSKRSSFSQLA